MPQCRRLTLRRLSPILLLAPTVGCGPGGPLRVRLDPATLRPDPAVVLFICDGLSRDLLRQGCRDGRLPNIQRRFLENGTRVENAVGAIPSITYSLLATFATGAPPAEHHVLGNHWFDRRSRLYRDYATIAHYRSVNHDFDLPTIYERIQPRSSASIQSPLKRGRTKNFANWAGSGVRWFFGDYTAVDKLTAATIDRVARWANQQGRWPDLLTCYFPGVDTIGHIHGVQSDRYQSAVEHLDYQVGRVCDWLEREGLLDTTYIVLVSDHGLVTVSDEGRIDLTAYARDVLGRNATDRSQQGGSFDKRRRHFERFDTVVVHEGVRCGNLHFAGPNGWDDVPSPATVREIIESPPPEQLLWVHPGVDLVAYLIDDQRVQLRSPRGAATIVQRNGEDGLEYRYVPEPHDVLGYTAEPRLAEFVAAGFHDSRAWLAATAAHQHPDVIAHLSALLRSPRCGQVVIFAARGYSFDREKSGHGGILREELAIPMLFAGPGIEAGGSIEWARAVDLAPTLLRLLGTRPPTGEQFPGLPLFERDDSDAWRPTDRR